MGAAGRAQSQPPALGSGTPRHRPLQVPLLITPIGGAPGTPCLLAIGAVSVSWACAWRPVPRRGSLGMPRCLRRRLPPCALRGFPATGRPLGSAPGGSFRRRPLRASSPTGDSCSGSLLFLPKPARGHEVDGRFGDSLALRIALASPGFTWERFFLSAFWIPYTLPTSDFLFPPLILESSQEIAPNLCFLSEGARLTYKNHDTD